EQRSQKAGNRVRLIGIRQPDNVAEDHMRYKEQRYSANQFQAAVNKPQNAQHLNVACHAIVHRRHADRLSASATKLLSWRQLFTAGVTEYSHGGLSWGTILIPQWSITAWR